MALSLDELVLSPALVNQQAGNLEWDELLFEYELALDDLQAWLRGLNDAQIHFKLIDQPFSIAELVSHGCLSDEMFLGGLAALLQGRAAEIDLATLTGGAGARNDVPLSDLEGMNEGCRTLARNTIESRPDPVDLTIAVLHPAFGALNAKGWLYCMAVQRAMQRRQCEQVIDSPGFPRGASLQTQPREAYQSAGRKTWLTSTPKKSSAPKKTTAKKKTAGKSSQK